MCKEDTLEGIKNMPKSDKHTIGMNAAFTVKAGGFEGPLDLLLSLIEERKFLVNDVSLTKVADDFLEYLKSQPRFPMGQAAQFILIAATLILLKSRSLLPVLSLSAEEEGDIHDLEFRLKIYQVFRDIARSLGAASSRMFFGDGARVDEPLFSPSPDLSVQNLTEALSRALEGAPRIVLAPEVSVQNVVTLEEMIDRLSERIAKAINLTFKEFAGTSQTDKKELVVSFLAMLELVKRGMLAVSQEASFGEIKMNYQGTVRAPNFE